MVNRREEKLAKKQKEKVEVILSFPHFFDLMGLKNPYENPGGEANATGWK